MQALRMEREETVRLKDAIWQDETLKRQCEALAEVRGAGVTGVLLGPRFSPAGVMLRVSSTRTYQYIWTYR